MNPVEQVKNWVKRNPRIAAAGALGGGFLFLKSKGGGSGDAAAIDGSQVAILPVATSPSETVSDGTGTGDGVSTGDDSLNPEGEGETNDTPATDDTDPSKPEPLDPEVTETTQPEAPTPANASVAAPTAGVDIAGKHFPGATGRQMVGSASNQYGKYTIWLVSYPSKSERWWHYYADEKGRSYDKWTGPHTGTGNSGGPVSQPPAGKPAETKAAATPAPPAVSHPAPTVAVPHPAAVPAPKEQPHMGANIFYNADRNLRYIIQKHDNKKNYRHYESRLNKGDWGTGGVIPA